MGIRYRTATLVPLCRCGECANAECARCHKPFCDEHAPELLCSDCESEWLLANTETKSRLWAGVGVSTTMTGLLLLPAYGGFALACLCVAAGLTGGLGATAYTRRKRTRRRAIFLSEGASYWRLRGLLEEALPRIAPDPRRPTTSDASSS